MKNKAANKLKKRLIPFLISLSIVTIHDGELNMSFTFAMDAAKLSAIPVERDITTVLSPSVSKELHRHYS